MSGTVLVVLHLIILRMTRLADSTFVIGFNFMNTPEADRSFVALNEAAQGKIYERAAAAGVQSLVILSTCNRTELYGRGDHVETLRNLYFEIANIPSNLQENLFVATGENALKHIFLVASGLNSQIIGDLEILGQFKAACKTAKKRNMLDGYFERLTNTCIESAKEIRNETRITSGTISLSYAAAKILHDCHDKPSSKVLVIGAGEFGSSIARDVRHFLPAAELFITNRTLKKAEKVADTFNGSVIPFEEYTHRLSEFDIIITAVGNAQAYLVTPSSLNLEKGRILIDMSVPKAIDKEVAQMEGTRLVSIDDASRVINESMETRKSDLPLANAIVEKYLEKFLDWSAIFEKREVIATWKNMLAKMVDKCPVLRQFEPESQRKIMKQSMTEFSVYLKNNPSLSNDPNYIIQHFLRKHSSILSLYKGAVPVPLFEYNHVNG